MRPIRSLLFAPGNRPDLLRKFVRYHCDAYVIDLEDATPAKDKVSARVGLADVVRHLREEAIGGLLFVRTNDTASPHFVADLSASLAAPIDGIMLPKLASVDELRRVDDDLDRAEARTARRLDLIGLIETAAGVMNVDALATCESPHLCSAPKTS